MGDHFIGQFFDALGVGVEDEFRLLGRLVRVVDTGEAFDLTGAGLFVQAFRVACLARFERCLDVYFDELAHRNQLANVVAVLAIGRNERGRRQDAGIGHQSCDLADAADILGSVLGREAEILVEAMAHVVAIEQVGVDPHLVQLVLHRVGDGALARAAQTGEP